MPQWLQLVNLYCKGDHEWRQRLTQTTARAEEDHEHQYENSQMDSAHAAHRQAPHDPTGPLGETPVRPQIQGVGRRVPAARADAESTPAPASPVCILSDPDAEVVAEMETEGDARADTRREAGL